MTPSMAFAAIALLIAFWAVGAYRRLASQRKHCKTAFIQLDAQLMRRHDLLPSLIEVAAVHVKDERDALDAVLAADNEAVAAGAQVARNVLNAAALARMDSAETALAEALGRMFALAQRHAELASDQSMRQLTEDLSAVESKIVFARQVYNEAASQYNAARAQFPGSVIAFVFAFTPVALLQNAGVQRAHHS